MPSFLIVSQSYESLNYLRWPSDFKMAANAMAFDMGTDDQPKIHFYQFKCYSSSWKRFHHYSVFHNHINHWKFLDGRQISKLPPMSSWKYTFWWTFEMIDIPFLLVPGPKCPNTPGSCICIASCNWSHGGNSITCHYRLFSIDISSVPGSRLQWVA